MRIFLGSLQIDAVCVSQQPPGHGSHTLSGCDTAHTIQCAPPLKICSTESCLHWCASHPSAGMLLSTSAASRASSSSPMATPCLWEWGGQGASHSHALPPSWVGQGTELQGWVHAAAIRAQPDGILDCWFHIVLSWCQSSPGTSVVSCSDTDLRWTSDAAKPTCATQQAQPAGGAGV